MDSRATQGFDMITGEHDTYKFLNNTFNMGSSRAKLNPNGELDVWGDISWKGTHKLYLRFGEVDGNFSVDERKLKNLKGAPRKVTKTFRLTRCGLRDLKGGPREVGTVFFERLEIENLVNGPEIVQNSYRITDCGKLSSLQGCIPVVNGDFQATKCALTSMIGGPHEVGGSYNVTNNPLTSLDGLPKKVGGVFMFTWRADLPLLRLIGMQADTIIVRKGLEDDNKLAAIIKEFSPLYERGPNRAMMSCQRAMVNAGYEGNARW